jgi:MFS family permease
VEKSPNNSWLRFSFTGILPLFVLAHFAHHLLTSLPVPLLPMIRSDFSLDYTQTGLLLAAFNLSYGIGQIPSGWLADRFGARNLLAAGICGVAIAGFLVGISQSFIGMTIFMALMGALGGGYHPSASPMIFAAVDTKKQGQALGLHALGGSGSFFLSPLIAVAIAASFTWRWSFISLAAPTIAFGIVFYMILGKKVQVKRTPSKGEEPKVKDLTAPYQLRPIIVFIFLTAFLASVIFSVISFVPLYLVDHLGVRKEIAGASYSLIHMAGLWMGPIAGYLSDRWGRKRMMLTICFLSTPIIYLVNWVSAPWAVVLLLLAIGMIIYTRIPVSESYIIRHTPRHLRSTFIGIYFFGSMEGSGLFSPAVGYLIDHLGFYNSFTIAAGAMLVTTLICAFMLRGSSD